MKKRDFNVLLSQKGEINLSTRSVKSKKIYNRKKYKSKFKKTYTYSLYKEIWSHDRSSTYRISKIFYFKSSSKNNTGR